AQATGGRGPAPTRRCGRLKTSPVVVPPTRIMIIGAAAARLGETRCLKGQASHHEGVLARSYFAGDIFDRIHHCRPWRWSCWVLSRMGRSRRLAACASVGLG